MAAGVFCVLAAAAMMSFVAPSAMVAASSAVFHGSAYDYMLEWLSVMGPMQDGEVAMQSPVMMLQGWDGSCNGIAGMVFNLAKRKADIGLGTFDQQYGALLDAVEADELTAGCLLHAMAQYSDFKKQNNDVMWYNRTGELPDFETLYDTGAIRRDMDVQFQGVDDVMGPYNASAHVGAVLRLDVGPDPRWFNPGLLWNLRNMQLADRLCGPQRRTVYSCFLDPSDGVMNTIVTGFLLVADASLNVTFENHDSFSTASPEGGFPALAVAYGRPAYSFAPFCGVPIPLV